VGVAATPNFFGLRLAQTLIVPDLQPPCHPLRMKAYLEEINLGQEKDEWPLTCILFAPEQNPVEDIWLNGKTWLRKFGKRLSSFSLVKRFFDFTIQEQSFDFPKLHQFGDFEPTFS